MCVCVCVRTAATGGRAEASSSLPTGPSVSFFTSLAPKCNAGGDTSTGHSAGRRPASTGATWKRVDPSPGRVLCLLCPEKVTAISPRRTCSDVLRGPSSCGSEGRRRVCARVCACACGPGLVSGSDSHSSVKRLFAAD